VRNGYGALSLKARVNLCLIARSGCVRRYVEPLISLVALLYALQPAMRMISASSAEDSDDQRKLMFAFKTILLGASPDAAALFM
jgi:hypothetical protein